MASSSNQPGENMAVRTSKPENNDMLLPSRISSKSNEISELGNSDGDDNESDGTNSDGEDNESDGGQKYGLSWFDDFQMVDNKSVVDQAYKISRMVADHAKSCPRLHMVLNDKVELVNVIIEKLPVSWEDYAATLKEMQMQKELSFGALVNNLRVEEEERAEEEEEIRAEEEEEERAQHQKVEFVEEKNEYSGYLPLYKATLRGDWATAERFFDKDPGALTAPINDYSNTALLVAAVHGRNDFVKKLVDKMPPASVDEAYGKVLIMAAYVGNTEAVKAILSKNPSLVYYREDDNNNIKWTPFIKVTPLTQAAASGRRDTLLYLLEFVKNDEDSSKLFPDGDSAASLMNETICSGYYDIALYLVKKYPLSAFSVRNDGCFGLETMARNASAFKSGNHYRWWQRIIYAHVPMKSVDCIISPTLTVLVENPVDDPDQVMRRKYNWARLLVEYFCISVPCIKHIQKQKEMHLQTLELVKCFCKGIASLPYSAKHRSLTREAMFSAARNGVPEIVHEIVESFPSVIWTRSPDGRRVFDEVILQRQENAFNLVYQLGKYSRENFIRGYNRNTRNNILHLAGKLAPPTKLIQISGAALQMQLELQWFEAVKKLMSPRDIDWRNKDGKTPAMIFTEEHKELVAEGEKWMKDTAKSCTIPTALIVTIVFAAAITVPGGINGTNGLPVFNKEVVFNIFAVSDAISLFTSITSLLVHLSILTSRFAEGDFLFALPNRLIIGLFTLFLSIAAMLIAFSCAIYLLLGNRAWILYPVAGLACVPIISFASLQYPLLRDLMKSTYGPGIFGKQSEVPFFSSG